jgi:topoisomerase-4 subunit A
VLSEKGWVRSAKGHEIDPVTLSYKAGDSYLDSVPMRSNQQVVFLDSHGRSYSLPAHGLPSARGQGEPLTGRLSPPPGAQFVAVLAGEQEQWFVVASDAGYGFRVQLQDMLANKKAGKAILSVPNNARALKPARQFSEQDRVVVVTSDGHMLVFPASELPAMSRGKGNKLISLPVKKGAAAAALVAAIASVPATAQLKVLSGKRHVVLKPADLDAYLGERGRRGGTLPRGFQKIDGLDVLDGA